MITSPRGIRRTLRARPVVATLAAGLVLATAACGSGDDAGSASGGGGGGGGPSAEQLEELEQLVSAAQEVPVYEDPGPPVDLSSLAGQKVMVIPTASQLPVCDQIGKDIAELAEEVGMTGTYFENSGGPQGWIPGMQQAVSQDYDAIVLVCGIDPNLITPQVQAATDAGIAVIDSGLFDTEDGGTDPLVTAQTNIPNAESIRRSVDVAFLDNGEEPFDVVMVTSDEVPAGVKMEEAIRDEFATYCPGCEIQKVNVAIPDWGTKIQGEVSSALLANPDIKAVIPIFDGMVPPAGAAVTASGRDDVFLYGCYGGTPAYISEMGESIPMRSDTGPTHLWRAYATADQMFRVLTGGEALDPNDAFDPHRLWTLDNKDDVTGENDGFGTEFVTGYRTLWGLE
jgi:ribose transport system substrate-binding protein